MVARRDVLLDGSPITATVVRRNVIVDGSR
jgi:hypothetical protein